ncbi:TRAP transporter large permease [Chloroflexota bacterium]
MSPFVIGIIGIFVLFLLFAFQMHIGVALGLVGLVGFSCLAGLDKGLPILGLSPYSTSFSYSFTVIPLFVLMGEFISRSGLGREIYHTAYQWVGPFPGGLAMATVAGCAGFAAVSGSSTATAATLGTVSLPEMKRYKYDSAFSTGALAAGGTLGILIPPSVTFILYGQLAEQSIGQLFIAGILPGILLATMFMLYIYIRTRLNPAIGPRGPKVDLKDKLISLKGSWGILVLFLLVIGGIYFGIFTPIEAAGIGALGAFFFSLGTRRLTWQVIRGSLNATVQTTAMIMVIIIGAMIFSYFLAISRIPFELANFTTTSGLPNYVVLSLIFLIFLALGCIMSGFAVIILLVPIVFPAIVALGFDPIWFGVIVVVLIEMGLVTPPVGMNVYVIGGIAKDVPMYTIFRGVIPFFLVMLVGLIILVLFPQISLFLPSLM